jgi:hypothetical protein
MDIAVAEAAAVPVLVRVMLFAVDPVAHVGVAVLLPPFKVAPTRAIPVTWTWAELDDEPKIPNTKPPIATAAMRVTAMISTVAMIGEMAFLCPENLILQSPPRAANHVMTILKKH